MNRRKFLILAPALFLLPNDAMANPLVSWIARGILRSAFRLLSQVGGRYTVRTVGRSVLRTSSHISRPSRMIRTFGRKIHKIKNRHGKVIGSAKVEGNVLIIRDIQKKILGYIQAEKNLFSVYNGAGSRVITFRQKSERVIAYDKDENYIGQIIKKEIKGQIKDFFIDALGKEHDSVPIDLQVQEEIVKNKKDNNINDGKLKFYNDKNQLVLYGVQENGYLLLYNTDGIRKGKIERDNGKLYIYNNRGDLMQSVLETETKKIRLDF